MFLDNSNVPKTASIYIVNVLFGIKKVVINLFLKALRSTFRIVAAELDVNSR